MRCRGIRTTDGSTISVAATSSQNTCGKHSSARGGAVEEGSVGAGRGTFALGWKGGIGTSSRRPSGSKAGYTVGVLVQTNFGGSLTIAGVPVWRQLKPPQRREGAGGSAICRAL